MKTVKTIQSVILGALLLATTYCGSSGTQDDFQFTGLFEGLYVTGSTPAHNQLYVPTNTTTFTIRMSEDVNPDSLANQIQVVTDPTTNSDTCGGTPVTSNFTITSAGNIITLTATGTLQNNKDYEIQLFPGISSVAGNTLLQGQQFSCFYIDVSTGNGGTAGQSVQGPPQITGFQKSPQGGCFGAIVNFNESLATQPIMYTKHKGPDTFFSWVTNPVWAQPVMAGNMAQWRVIDCNVPTLSEVKIEVESFIDFDEGLHGTGDASSIWYWAGY